MVVCVRRAFGVSGFPFADFGSCPEQSDCLAPGWSCQVDPTARSNKTCPPPCKAPAGRHDCACPWCGGPWVRNSSGPAGSGTGQGPLPSDGPRNITQGDATRLGCAPTDCPQHCLTMF